MLVFFFFFFAHLQKRKAQLVINIFPTEIYLSWFICVNYFAACNIYFLTSLYIHFQVHYTVYTGSNSYCRKLSVIAFLSTRKKSAILLHFLLKVFIRLLNRWSSPYLYCLIITIFPLKYFQHSLLPINKIEDRPELSRFQQNSTLTHHKRY